MQSEQCLHCRHYQGQATCAAYPNGIPSDVMTGKVDHRKPVKGDHGIRFEPLQPTPLRDLVPEKGGA